MMVDLTKGINSANAAINKAASQIQASKAARNFQYSPRVVRTPEQVAEEIRKTEIIAEIAKNHAKTQIPDYVRDMIRMLGR